MAVLIRVLPARRRRDSVDESWDDEVEAPDEEARCESEEVYVFSCDEDRKEEDDEEEAPPGDEESPGEQEDDPPTASVERVSVDGAYEDADPP